MPEIDDPSGNPEQASAKKMPKVPQQTEAKCNKSGEGEECPLHGKHACPELKEETLDEKRGLYANIHAKRKRGERPARPGEEDYPAKDAFKKSARTAKKESIELDEVAPPGAKSERMVKHIKKSYSKDGKLTAKEKAIAYATAWKHHNKMKKEHCDMEFDVVAHQCGHCNATGYHPTGEKCDQCDGKGTLQTANDGVK